MQIMRKAVILLLVGALAGCRAATTVSPITTPNATPPPPISTTTPPALPTLSSFEAEAAWMRLLENNGGCALPCFWGIHPDSTTFAEAQKLFHHLGKQDFISKEASHIYDSFGFTNRDGLNVEVELDVQGDVVRNMKVRIGELWHPEIAADSWRLFTPAQILDIYGQPSNVEVYLDLPNNLILYGFRMTYTASDIRILFLGMGSKPYRSDVQGVTVCPMKGEITDVNLWLGKNPFKMDPSGLALETAAGITAEQFHKLFTRHPELACLDLNVDAFPGMSTKQP